MCRLSPARLPSRLPSSRPPSPTIAHHGSACCRRGCRALDERVEMPPRSRRRKPPFSPHTSNSGVDVAAVTEGAAAARAVVPDARRGPRRSQAGPMARRPTSVAESEPMVAAGASNGESTSAGCSAGRTGGTEKRENKDTDQAKIDLIWFLFDLVNQVCSPCMHGSRVEGNEVLMKENMEKFAIPDNTGINGASVAR
ncbi:hypothetical protein EJB05_21808, partial [Eragrostis curvula]